MTTHLFSHEPPTAGKTADVNPPSGSPIKRIIDAPFSLRDDFSALSEKENLAFFNKTFPGNKGYDFDGLFLHIYLDPPHSSFQMFAGVPIIFVPPHNLAHTHPRAIPPGFLGVPKQGPIAHNLDYRGRLSQDGDWQPLFVAIVAYFKVIEVPITEVIYWGYFVQIVLRDSNTDRAILPFRAGRLGCRYLYESEMGRPVTLQSQTRHKYPSDGKPDDTAYNTLRPGVRVSSDFIPRTEIYHSSTLGTRVHDANGDAFITVAAHTFLSRNALVFHPLRPGGRTIGQLAGRIGTTDVGLLSLAPHERFSNDVFLSTGYEDADASPQIRGLRKAKQFDTVTLDSPDTGVIYGQVMGFSKRSLSDKEGEETEWVDIEYIFVGKNNDELLPDSMCGAVVRSDDQDILSFFQYQIIRGDWKGWCTGTSSKELLYRGYS